MDLAFLARAFKRTPFTASQMVVMGADQNVLRSRRISRGWNPRQDIVVSFSDLLDGGRDFECQLWYRKASLSMRVLAVERGLQPLQLFAGGAKNGRGHCVADTGGDNAGAGEAGVKGERCKLAGVW